MSYTVTLRESVPEELRDELARRLSTRFGLSGEQAHKLAGRKPGRLLKPTTRARAETLLSLYQALDLNAILDNLPGDVPTDEANVPNLSAASFGGAISGGAAVAAPDTFESFAQAVSSTVFAPALTGPAPSPLVSSNSSNPVSDRPALAVSEPVLTVERPPADDLPAVPAAATGPKPKRRLSLRRRVVLTTVLPLLLTGVAWTVGTVLSTQQFQRSLNRDSARALAASVGSSVNVEDTFALDAQLRSLLQQPNVGFISVRTPSGLQFFRSKNPDADSVLGSVITKYIAAHPGASTFTDTEKPSERFAAQLQQLRDSGVELGSSQAALEAKIKASENQQATTNYYEIQQVGIYARKDNQGVVRKVAGDVNAANGQKPLYSVAVGVLTNTSQAYLRQSLITNILLALLFTTAATLIAIRTARRIVQPIERLVVAADAISLGQLDTPVVAEHNDEIGDLAKALERMRLSLDAAIERLRKRRVR